MKYWLKVLTLTIGFFLISILYAFLENKLTLDKIIDGLMFFPVVLLSAGYYFYHKDR
ncbi:hypothetical protein EV697_102172 [Bisgaardia hudsonensis]|uniref:Uncharacterized protein n=1 Tax=Bisgaardia hudsonensis TaxID=109472 RepID=A0A4R2N162_9PAST|nr:hypothetical protein [Bisgaardia hudsonensis]TCP13295.1 hypothetical protein EV697_102172 [Bisgaardia hudsonensis]